MITFTVDLLTPCLVDTLSGDIVETEVLRIRRKSFLAKFNKRSGWFINWASFPDSVEIYALVLKGTVSIQGLIALERDDVNQAIHVRWGCTSPDNNIWKYNAQKYKGVGGHLLAIVADISFKYGYDGFFYGEATNEKLYHYYIDEFGAIPIPIRGENPYRFMVNEEQSRKIREVYTYEWTNDEI